MFTYCAIDGFHPVSENSENKLIVCKTPMGGLLVTLRKTNFKESFNVLNPSMQE